MKTISTKFLQWSVAVLVLVITISLAFLLAKSGKDMFAKATEDLSEYGTAASEKYAYLDGATVSGSELKEYYRDTRGELVWSIKTLASDGFFNGIDPTEEVTGKNYVNDEGLFMCSLERNRGVVTGVIAEQQ